MRKVKLVTQAEHSECGLACITMVLNHQGVPVRLQELRDRFGVPRGGYRLTDLTGIFGEYGAEAKAVRASGRLEALPVPFIAFWNQRHYLVVENVKKKRVLICDPATGRRWIGRAEFDSQFSGIALLAERKTAAERRPDPAPHFLRKFLSSQFKGPLISLFFLTCLVQLFTLLMPMGIQRLIDGQELLSLTSLPVLLGGMAAVGVLYYLLQVFRGIIVANFQKGFDLSLMTFYMQKLLHLPVLFFLNRSTGELIFRSNLSVYIKQVLTQKVVLLFVDSLFLLFYVALMLSYSATLTAISLGIALVMVAISVLSTRRIKQFVDLEIIEQAKVQKNITEMVEGIETVKATGTEQAFFEKWKEDFSRQIAVTAKKDIFASKFATIPQTLQFMMPLLLLVTGVWLIAQGSLTIGTLIAFTTLAGAFITPVMSLSGVYNDLVLLQSYFGKLEEIIEHPGDRQDGGGQIGAVETLRLDGVTFSYSRFDQPILKDLTLKVGRGEKVAIVGESGSGKSTVLKLMSGLIQPTEGQVRLNGRPLKSIDRQLRHRKMALTNQSAMIFNASIKDNITLNRAFDCQNEADMRRMQRVLHASGVQEMIQGLPLGIETVISEQGANLSGGQRQKIAIARSLYQTPEVYLLDEPTSALDNIAERHIMKAVFQEEATCIVVAHRLQTIKDIGRIIVMDGGRIVGDGTHQELMQSNLHYRKLYQEEQKVGEAS